MIHFKVDKNVFTFRYLPEYAEFILKNKLEEYVTVGIRFSREADLPLLKPLSKLSEQELVALSIDSNREILSALSKNQVYFFIEKNAQRWIDNTIGLIDQHDVTGEDLTLAFYIRRKIFAYFLDAYTKNVVEQKFIIAEVDAWTSQEELISVNIFLQLQKKKMEEKAQEAALQMELLLETQEIVEMGSYAIISKDRTKSIYTPQYLKILELPTGYVYEKFVENIHPEDRVAVKDATDRVLANGGDIEVEYRYNGAAGEKRIWAKAIVELENGKIATIKGVIRDVTKKFHLIERLRESDQHYRQAQELTLLGNWSWELGPAKLNWSEEMFKIFGLRKNSPVTLAQYLELIQPQFREKVRAQLETVKPDQQPSEEVFKIRTAQGLEKIIHSITRVETKGKVITRIHGTCHDITRSELLRQVLIS